MNLVPVELRILVPPPNLSITHPFVVFERPGEAHGLDELGEGSDLLLCVLGRLLHITELQDHKHRHGINAQKRKRMKLFSFIFSDTPAVGEGRISWYNMNDVGLHLDALFPDLQFYSGLDPFYFCSKFIFILTQFLYLFIILILDEFELKAELVLDVFLLVWV